MEDKSGLALELIQADEGVSWVRDQLVSSFAEGITQSAKERSSVTQSDFFLVEDSLPSRERNKREKYETSRPYEEAEKIELIQHALHEVFVTIPALQNEVVRALSEFGVKADYIEFSTPDEEQPSGNHHHRITMRQDHATDLAQRFDSFKEKLKS